MFHSTVDQCNALAKTWAGWMGTSLLSATIVLALMSLLWLLIRRKASPQLGYLLFLLIPLKLFVPLEVTVLLPVASWMPRVVQNVVSPQATTVPLPLDAETSLPSVAASPPPTLATEAEVPSAVASAMPVPSISHHSDGPHSTLSPVAWLMLFWVLSVLVLFVRVVYAQFQFLRRVVRKANPMNPAAVAADFTGLLRRIGVRKQVRIVESDQIASPVVWGIFRPMLILPAGIAASLSARQVEWVLLHELAHVQRRDLMVNCFQRVATILHFVNPAIWIANRMIGRLREFACDDMAIAFARSSQLESGEAFLGVMRYAALVQHRPEASLQAAIGVFESTSRSACFQRMSRLLDTNRRVSVKLRFGSLCTVLLMAVLALPQIRAAANQATGEQTASKDADKQPTAITQAAADTKGSNQNSNKMVTAVDDPAIGATVEGQRFELIVLGPDEKPVPQATVEIRGRKRLTVEQIQIGQFLKNGNYGADTYWTTAQSDAGGLLAFQVPKDMNPMGVCIEQPGYGPYLAWFGSRNNPSTIPSRFVVALEAGWSLGGVLVDPQGHLIQGAKVKAIRKYKTPDSTASGVSSLRELTSDAEGKWRCDSVPVSMNEVFVEINHPEFQPLQRSLTRGGFGIPQGAQPTAKIEVPRGIIVVGKVTDEAGTPIASATVRARTLRSFSIREAKTDEHGQYKLIGCAPQTARIMVAAKGRATDMKEVAIGDAMEPVNFMMKPGGRVRVRVEDEKGNPIPKADVRIDQWRGEPQFFAFGNVNRQADDNGMWEWGEAPSDEFKVGISRPDGMSLRSQPLVARDEEYVFRCPPALEISGSVIDAETKQSVKAFRVVPGHRYETNLFWNTQASYIAADGHYQFRDNLEPLAHLIRIEADGYLVATSRDIKSDERTVRVNFELKKTKNVSATVLTPRGQPAAGAEMVLGIADSFISIHNGRIRNAESAVRYEADAEGRFSFPNPDCPFQLVILHPSGFAHVKSDVRDISDKISLTAWAKVEGTFRVGSQTAANVPIAINSSGIRVIATGEPRIYTDYQTSTDVDGRFVFDRVFPGTGDIGRNFVTRGDGGVEDVTSSCRVPVTLVAGQTVNVDIGGSGRPVVGKLTSPPGHKEKVLWNYARIFVRSDLPALNPPMPPGLNTTEQRENWLATEGGKIWQTASNAYEKLRSQTLNLNFMASVAADGSFRIDDMPAGTYSMTVRLAAPGTENLLRFRFTVPPIDGSQSSEPLQIRLEEARGPMPAPPATPR